MEDDPVTWGWDDYFSDLARFLRELGRQAGIASVSYADYAIERLEMCEGVCTHLVAVLNAGESIVEGEESVIVEEYRHRFLNLKRLLQSLRIQWVEYCSAVESSPATSYQAPLLHQPHQRGRPTFLIPQQQLEYLRSLSFTWVEIAALLGVSRMTVYRRRVEYDMIEDPRIIPDDSELRHLVEKTRQELPYLGEVMVMGRLRALGYYVTRSRLRQVIHDTDPINRALRWGSNLHVRRPYSVPGPNSLWHIGILYYATYKTCWDTVCTYRVRIQVFFFILYIYTKQAISQSCITIIKSIVGTMDMQ